MEALLLLLGVLAAIAWYWVETTDVSAPGSSRSVKGASEHGGFNWDDSNQTGSNLVHFDGEHQKITSSFNEYDVNPSNGNSMLNGIDSMGNAYGYDNHQ